VIKCLTLKKVDTKFNKNEEKNREKEKEVPKSRREDGDYLIAPSRRRESTGVGKAL